MKTKTVLFTLFVLFLLIGGVGCEKEYVPPADPQKAILGKWYTIEAGGFLISSKNVTEFLSDGTIKQYDKSHPQGLITGTYSINDSLFIFGNIECKYNFYENKFYYEFINVYAMVMSYTLQRVK